MLVIAGVLVPAAGAVLLLSVRTRQGSSPSSQVPAAGYAGSTSCRDCHERFYRLWSTSHHGLAMQPFTTGLARAQLTPQKQDIVVGDRRYRAEVEAAEVRESTTTAEILTPLRI